MTKGYKVQPAKRIVEYFSHGYNESRPQSEWPLPQHSFLEQHGLAIPPSPDLYEIETYETPSGTDDYLHYAGVSMGKVTNLRGRAGNRQAA